MTSNVFKDITSRLEAYYSSSGKPVEIEQWALKEYYNACFCVLDGDARSFYSDLVSAYKFFPRVSEFRDVAEKYRKDDKKHYSNSEFCYCCMNTGTVPYFKKGLPPYVDYEYRFDSRCFCAAGKNRTDWPLCTSVVTQGEIDWLISENFRRYGNIEHDEAQKSKVYVTQFVKRFGSCSA